MSPDQARAAARLAYDFVYHYLDGDGGGLVPTNAQFVELTDGNFRASDHLAGRLAMLRKTTFDEVLDDLHERDEGYPPDPAAPMWDTTVDMLKYVHAHSWQQLPQPSPAYDVATACRSSFNLVIALVIEYADQTGSMPADAAKQLRDAV